MNLLNGCGIKPMIWLPAAFFVVATLLMWSADAGGRGNQAVTRVLAAEGLNCDIMKKLA